MVRFAHSCLWQLPPSNAGAARRPAFSPPPPRCEVRNPAVEAAGVHLGDGVATARRAWHSGPRMSLDPAATPLPSSDAARDSGRRPRGGRRAPGAGGRDRQADRRPGAGDRAAARRAVRARALPVRRRAGPGQDAADPDAGRGAGSDVRPHPVHARSDAGRHHRHRRARGGSRHRPARVPVRARADVRQRRARRRDQPHAAQDPGGAAAVDAGVPRHGRRADLRAAAAVPGVRHPEPDRAGGHLSRCPRRSSIASCSRSTSAIRRRTRRSRSSTSRPSAYRPELRKVLSPERILELQELVLRVPAAPHVVAVRGGALPRRRRPTEPTRARVHQGVRGLGRRAARLAVPGPGGQGARDPRRPLRGVDRGRPRAGRCRCCSTACSRTSTPRPKA